MNKDVEIVPKAEDEKHLDRYLLREDKEEECLFAKAVRENPDQKFFHLSCNCSRCRIRSQW